jgi:hypothetical protein
MAPQSKPPIDFAPLAKVKGYSTRVLFEKEEEADDRAARIARETADAFHARWQGTATFAAVLIGVAAVTMVCGILAVREGGSPDDRKWAMTILGSIVSAGVGFLTGRNQGR